MKLQIKEKYKGKKSTVHLQTSPNRGIKIELDKATKEQMELLKTAGHDAVEEARAPAAK